MQQTLTLTLRDINNLLATDRKILGPINMEKMDTEVGWITKSKKKLMEKR